MWQPNVPRLNDEAKEAIKKLPFFQRHLLGPALWNYHGHKPEYAIFSLKHDLHLENHAAFRDTIETRFRMSGRAALWGVALLYVVPMFLYHSSLDTVRTRSFLLKPLFDRLCCSPAFASYCVLDSQNCRLDMSTATAASSGSFPSVLGVRVVV